MPFKKLLELKKTIDPIINNYTSEGMKTKPAQYKILIKIKLLAITKDNAQTLVNSYFTLLQHFHEYIMSLRLNTTAKEAPSIDSVDKILLDFFTKKMFGPAEKGFYPILLDEFEPSTKTWLGKLPYYLKQAHRSNNYQTLSKDQTPINKSIKTMLQEIEKAIFYIDTDVLDNFEWCEYLYMLYSNIQYAISLFLGNTQEAHSTHASSYSDFKQIDLHNSTSAPISAVTRKDSLQMTHPIAASAPASSTPASMFHDRNTEKTPKNRSSSVKEPVNFEEFITDYINHHRKEIKESISYLTTAVEDNRKICGV